jgi:transaldolase
MENISNKIKIFYDGIDIDRYINICSGTTTNLTFMKEATVKYNTFKYNDIAVKLISQNMNKPISFQIFADNINEIEKQAREISSWGENIYVKIPIVNSSGIYLNNLITKLNKDGIKINITTVFSKKQVDMININSNTPTIISIFSGRISDTGVYPNDIIKYTIDKFINNKNIEILWAGCKTTLDIFEAIKTGCHIITVPSSVLDRLDRLGKDLDKFSIETSYDFRKNALDGNLQILY